MRRCVAFGILVFVCRSLQAVSIPIVNPSFESQFLNDGAWIDGTLTGWNVSGFFAGPQNWTDAQFPGATEGGAPSTVPDGRNSAFIRVNGNSISQSTGATIEAGNRYQLDYSIGHRLDGYFPKYRAELLANGSVIAVDDTSVVPAPGQWVQKSLIYNAGSVGSGIGQQVSLRFTAYGYDDPQGLPGIYQVEVDNVQLSKTYVPQTHVLSVGVNWGDWFSGDIFNLHEFGPVTGIAGGINALHVANSFQELGASVDSVPLVLSTPNSPSANISLFNSAFNNITAPNRLGSNDTLVIYINSHGAFDNSRGEAYIGLNGSTSTLGGPQMNAEDKLYASDLHALLASDNLKTVNKIILLDSCNSGDFANELAVGIQKIGVVAASEPGKNANYVSKEAHASSNYPLGTSWFADILAFGLTVGSDGHMAADVAPFGNGDGHVSTTELETYFDRVTHNDPNLTHLAGEVMAIMDSNQFSPFEGVTLQFASSPDFEGIFSSVPEPSAFILALSALCCFHVRRYARLVR